MSGTQTITRKDGTTYEYSGDTGIGHWQRREIKIVLRNPLDHSDTLTYVIEAFSGSELVQEWSDALVNLVQNKYHLEKNFCFMGFPNTARTIPYLLQELNKAVDQINSFFHEHELKYTIQEVYAEDTIRNGLDPSDYLMNQLHNHFEILQGTVGNLSEYYRVADHDTKYAIRQLNIICHELESLMLSLRKQETSPEWVRSSQITTFLQAPRITLTDEMREVFLENGYDREFGIVYLHWPQLGKTLFEVFRDENAPDLDQAMCEAITHQEYFSGEFNIEWGNDVVAGNPSTPWHDQEQKEFREWLIKNNYDPDNKMLSLGYAPIGQVRFDDLYNGQDMNNMDPIEVRKILGRYLDIYSISILVPEWKDTITNEYNYCWTDLDYKEQQIAKMQDGYNYSSTVSSTQ
jgi:hypothetical protein